MEWLVNGFLARVGWALADLAVGIAVILVILLVTLGPSWLRQRRCSHPRFHETRACDAVCSDCGCNLGFIGAWREKVKAK